MVRKVFRVVALAIALFAIPYAAWAQTTPAPVAADQAAQFFDDSVLHDLYLDIKPRDWSTLKEHFLDNTYYTADFTWRGLTTT